MTQRCRLYLITPQTIDPAAFADTLAAALDAGDVACVQLRLKDVDDDAIRRACDKLRPVSQSRDVAFILNDRPDLAAATGCDGVHVGQEDAGYREARAALGSERIVGVTCHASTDLAFTAAQQPHDARTAPNRGQPDVLPHQVRSGQRFDGVEILVGQREQELLHQSGVVGDRQQGGAGLVGHTDRH